MFSILKAVARGVTYPSRAARRRPRTAILVAVGVLTLGGIAGGWYVRSQWRAAQVALAADRPHEARDRMAVCLAVWPRSPEVHLAAARAARLSGDPAAAEEHLNRCLELQGGATDAVQLEFLLLRVQMGEADELAGPLIEIVDGGHPESPLIMETLARAYIYRLRHKAAYACLTKWIELRPDAAKAYQWRGWVLERLDQPKAAADDYHRALELHPDLIPVRLRLVELFLEDKKVPEALPHVERLYFQAPDRPEVQARLGMCRFYQGRADEARKLMVSAVAHLPDDIMLLIHLAKLDLQEGRGAEAEKWLRRVLKADPADSEALYTLASALQLQGRNEEAAAALKEYEASEVLVARINTLLRERADAPTAGAGDYAEIGELLLRVGRERTGLYWLDRALERNPLHQQAHRTLAEYYERKGDAAKAATHRRQVRGPAPAPAPGGAPKP